MTHRGNGQWGGPETFVNDRYPENRDADVPPGDPPPNGERHGPHYEDPPPPNEPGPPPLKFYSLGELIRRFTTMREVVIDGLLRLGETMNVISAPKIGKSWLIIALIFAMVTGGPWMGFKTCPGEV